MNKKVSKLEANQQTEILIFEAKDGKISVDVQVKKETVWLSLMQLTALFERDKSVISRHIQNIFKIKELVKDATVAKFATAQTEGKREITRDIDFYNLDVIISLGYRVNSKRGIQFRKWANEVLKKHLIRGYTINHEKLALEGIDDIRKSINLLSRTLTKESNLDDIGQAALSLIMEYSKTWHLLLQYDENKLVNPKGKIALKKRFFNNNKSKIKF